MATLKWKEGDPIPEIGDEFEFDGGIYYWLPCPCSCERPTAYSARDGQISMFVTGMIRGRDQGSYIDDFLVAFYGLRRFVEADVEGANMKLWIEAKKIIEPVSGQVDQNLFKERDIDIRLYQKAVVEEEELSQMIQPRQLFADLESIIEILRARGRNRRN